MTTAPKSTKRAEVKKVFNKEQLWHVLLFDCDCHSYDEVVEGLLEAIGCTVDQAIQYALVAEEFGCVSIFEGSYEDCKKVARPLLRIGLRAEVESV